MGSRKIVLMIYCGAAKETGILDTVGEREGGIIWEYSSETHTLPYVK